MARNKRTYRTSRAHIALNHQQVNHLRRTEEGREALDRLNYELGLCRYSPRPLTPRTESESTPVEMAVAA